MPDLARDVLVCAVKLRRVEDVISGQFACLDQVALVKFLFTTSVSLDRSVSRDERFTGSFCEC